ncbi:unnamed protein product [Adineta steineri]|uniref:Uncharacterized protein n=2 Tax=Adineta steineri TaxID=433720 RepID=A0A819N1L6_9BILA|nr:unnamed protein product [Adineta steineri]CAF3989691.1 unnamed protein product [Adineta steineri]
MLVLIYLLILIQPYLNIASITIQDPGDIIDISKDTADNAIKANYNVMPVMYLLSPLQATSFFNGTQSSSWISHQTFSATANDTNVIVVGNGAQLNLSFVNIVKTGYSSNLLQASFFGVNAAINIQNGSRVFFDHLNVTTHNGAANLYSYGNGSYAYVENSFLYSSGPAAHGLYAGGYGTVVGKNIAHYSGGNRCSSFAGDAPAGYVTISDAIAHTNGIGSATFYALGTITATNVIGYAANAPALFSDGRQTSVFTNCDLTAGLLAGTVMFSSMIRQQGAMLNITNSRLTALGNTMPALWFGNVIATVYLYNTIINTASNILVTANYSQVTQDFNYYAGYPDNPNLLPAIVTINVVDCSLTGQLIAYNGSSINWIMSQYSTWNGNAYSGYGNSYISISLDSTSIWNVTGNTMLQNLTTSNNSLANINSNGYNISYDSNSTMNSWLNQTTVSLTGGGKLMPAIPGQSIITTTQVTTSSAKQQTPSHSVSIFSIPKTFILHLFSIKIFLFLFFH